MGSRVYTVKHKPTNQYIIDIQYKRLDRRKFQYFPVYSDTPKYASATSLAWMIRRMVANNIAQCLDDAEIEAFEVPEPLPYIPVKSGLKIPTLKKKYEAELIISKLKNSVII
jgi:hypothetical protein